MDNTRRLNEGNGLPSQTPRRVNGPKETLAAYPLRLVMQESSLAVEIVQSDTLVGRHPDVDLRLPLGDVSRRHCRFLFADNCWQVIDLNSTNGVWINDKRVQRTVLRHRDALRIGGFLFQVDLSAGRNTDKLPDTQQNVLKSIAKSLNAPKIKPVPPKRQAS